MAWYPDWATRAAVMTNHGLPATIVGVAWYDELLVLELTIPEAILPRSNLARGFDLHISLLFRNEYHDMLHDNARSLHARWAGRSVLLRVQRFGSGGAAMLHPADALAADEDLRALHSAGHYSGREIHVSL